jgi:hypothetical protein
VRNWFSEFAAFKCSLCHYVLECCLQEKAYNPYYDVLASKLCERQKKHRLTLQLCVWDQIREVSPKGDKLRDDGRGASHLFTQCPRVSSPSSPPPCPYHLLTIVHVFTPHPSV